MAVWTVYLSLCLLVALNASVETRPVESKHCGVCKEGWSAFGCRCFRFFSSHYTWAGAEKYCLYYNGNLASVHSHEEYMFIQKLVRQTTHATTRAWIGGSDAAEEGVWLWSDGTKMIYQIWSPGNPSNYLGKEHCLEMNYGNGNWNDGNCSVKKPFVCAK
ncbi:galactose-specific lectin nattectin-like isoform X2 [Ctenopharyngodon idella]|uniref:galactose-specific lectin nattectin-like isoform X2 n=1 Tax=Ctenopharyngodon idella TaxID=7959 RepID=UPI002230DD7E|nr:galactose-specific lectin nattectin-like isoform X2 [Ctenopharyngodon idella]